MKVTVKLFATLSDLLPPETRDNAVELEVPADITPNAVIDQFRVPRKLAHLVLRNGIYIEPEQRDQPLFEDGDVIAIWPPIAGG
ncbi:MAG: MoaD/ThiS family protein [Gammaproteobacteria bacterium]